MKHLVKKTDLRTGLALYVVYNMGDNSYIETLLVDRIIDDEWIDCWVYNHKLKNMSLDIFSLRDMGITPNDYNKHLTFLSLDSADKYLKSCLNQQR